MLYECPHCGAVMRQEMSKTMLSHPPGDCILVGRCFRLHKKSPKDPRVTWDEYCAMIKNKALPGSEPVAPAVTQAAPTFVRPAAPAMPPGMPTPPPVKPE